MILRQPVAQVDDRIRTLIADMGETMYAAHGIGLARHPGECARARGGD